MSEKHISEYMPNRMHRQNHVIIYRVKRPKNVNGSENKLQKECLIKYQNMCQIEQTEISDLCLSIWRKDVCQNKNAR